MRRVWSISRKELQQYFYSPTAYIAFAVFFLVNGVFFSSNFIGSQQVDVKMIFGIVMFLYMLTIPLLSMSLMSAEFAQGTDELLLTSPASITEIIIGKYIASFIVQAALVAGMLVYPLIMSMFGKLDQPILWLSFLSLLLLGGALMSVGLFASTLSANQMVTGVVAFVIIIVLWVISMLGGSTSTSGTAWIDQFSVSGRVTNLQNGVFDLPDVLFYISFIVVFVILSIQVLDRKRWR